MCMEIYNIFIFASSGNRSIGFLSQLMHLPFVSFPFFFFNFFVLFVLFYPGTPIISVALLVDHLCSL